MMLMRLVLVLLTVLAFANALAPDYAEVTVTNSLSIDRREVVAVSIGDLTKRLKKPARYFVVTRVGSNETMVTQLVDHNSDSVADELLFVVYVKAKEKVTYLVRAAEQLSVNSKLTTYSRFVPERTDDYAWENDLVAFRTYGPEAQRMIENNIKGGTLSSGLDCWLKRVDYPIINKWYRKYVDGGSYHKDTGEGYDPYHVGASRGCGGTGVWSNDSLYVSKNFVSYKRIASGPVRTIFELTYAPWKYKDVKISETKRITLDLGSQLYQVKESMVFNGEIPNVTIGITLHDKKGVTTVNGPKGWFSYWESIDDSELGTGVVISPKDVKGYNDFRTVKKDLSQLYVLSDRTHDAVYYTGFAWAKAGKIVTKDQWNSYLNQFAERLVSPLTVSCK